MHRVASISNDGCLAMRQRQWCLGTRSMDMQYTGKFWCKHVKKLEREREQMITNRRDTCARRTDGRFAVWGWDLTLLLTSYNLPSPGYVMVVVFPFSRLSNRYSAAVCRAYGLQMTMRHVWCGIQNQPLRCSRRTGMLAYKILRMII